MWSTLKCCKREARAILRLQQADVGFYSLYFPQRQKKKSSCHQTFQAAGAETAAVRVGEQSGPSLKWPAPFNSHLRPYTPTVKISVHTPRDEQGKRLITVPQGHTHTPPTAATTTSVKPAKSKTTATVSLCAHMEQVCVCISNRIRLNQQACPLLSAVIQRDLCTLSVFISKQSIEETGSGQIR